MFRKLRNRFLMLLMATVTVLLTLFFSAIAGYSYQSAEIRSTGMIERGFYELPKEEDSSNAGDLSPMFAIDINATNGITAFYSNFKVGYGFFEKIIEIAPLTEDRVGITLYNGVTLKYKWFPLDDGWRIVFLDISRDIQFTAGLVYLFIWVSMPLLGVIFLISKYFADRAINPIKESIERQNQFVADASHEIKTPLATISANASVLLDTANDEQKKWLGFIRDETIRLEKLTNNLLYLLRQPMVKSERVRCNFSEILWSVLMPLEATLYEKQIDCSGEIADNIHVMGNEEQLRRLAGILIDNAIKYTESRIAVSLRVQSRTVVLTVENNGIGIPEGDIGRIFDRFYRSDKARKYRGGFGLGLAMAKSIVTELKGDIKATSEPGKQTEFIVTLPPA